MDSDAGCLPGAILLVVLLLLDLVMESYFSAIRSVSEGELQEIFQTAGKPPEKILAQKDDPSGIKRAIWLLNAAVCGGAGFLCTRSPYPGPFLLAAVVLFYLLGKALPEMLGQKNARRLLLRRSGFATAVLTALSPLTYVLTVLSELCIRLFGVDPRSLEQEVTEDEIISMVNEGHEQGVLDAREAEMIQNIFEMDDKKAVDIMTHRKNVIAVSGNTNLRDAISFMVEQPVSRFPVYEDGIDNLCGVLHFKDAMKFHNMGNYDDWLIKDIPELLREARYIPETRGINVLFRNMQAEKLQMVIVMDEYGQTAGLVTMEDILEEIVGNIQDEYDNDVQLIRQEAGGSYLMDGMAPLEDVTETLEITLEDEEYDTLNGLLISKLDRIPADGEQAEVDAYGCLFQILKVENKMIRLVRITKNKKEE